ncbi:hypothetical protein ACROYT_G039539 [Oculina patagonica]
MYGNYVRLTILIASLMFVTGFISLLVLSATKVFPAQKGLSFEQATCRVTHSEISCETGNCTDCVPEDSEDASTSRCLKVYVLCEDGEFVNKTRSVSSEKHTGYLLRKDVYHLNDKCSYEIEPKICNVDSDSSRKNLEEFQLQKGKPGETHKYYRNPKVPDEVVYENHSKEDYQNVVLHSVMWPIALIGLSIIILTAAICFCPTRRDYRRIP